MAKLICLQAGHEGTTTGATGAPGEQEFTVRIRNRLSQILISKGFQVQLVNANPPASDINKDYSLFLAIHYDANIYGTGGGFVDFPEPSTDAATIESQRIAKDITSEYFKNSGIVDYPERSNGNTRYYYMWSRLSAKTPCVIIECGVGQDAHDKVILTDTDRVCNAIARGICKAFNVPFDAVVPPPPSVDYKAKYEALQGEFKALEARFRDYKTSTDLEISNKATIILQLTERIKDIKEHTAKA